MDKKIKQNGFEKEYTDCLNKLYSDNSGLINFKWFLDTAYKWAYRPDEHDVVILGASVPEELVMAAGAKPYWLTGGSLGSTEWSDELVPRDTDPVSRSILGYIKRPEIEYPDSLFIIPLTNDSMRKIAYILRSEGRKICLVDVPPDRNDKYACEKYMKQMKDMCAAISARTGVKVTKGSVASSMKRVSAARTLLKRFLEVSRGRTDIITDSARLFVQNSYYMTDSVDEWTYHVNELTHEIGYYASRSVRTGKNRPSVLICGSPVLFPNYKIPFLISDSGLEILEAVSYTSPKTQMIYNRKMMHGNADKLIKTICTEWLKYDLSPSYIRNDILYDNISAIANRGDIEGVVYHVLKGQIEYDFELERIEKMLSEYGISVFRLETDYQYQDVEQLRIRMEAFSEMLVQNRARRLKKVS